ncbi:MAG TPA: prolyl oligopeptidase family serine peptidase [Tepidisphaeraceae bacterium]
MSLVISSMQSARDALYVSLLDAGLNRVARLAYDSPGKLESIEIPPGFSSASLDSASNDTDGALIWTDSWIRGGQLCGVDPQTHHLIDSNLQPPGKFDDMPGFTAEEMLVPSYDGVKVPLSILHKTDITLDGSHPTLISGYGAYGLSETAYFSPSRLAWLERGGVLAIAHVRGGGEYGEAWHRAGQKLTKPNTWKDFVACGEYLIQQRYTMPSKLAGAGGSAGGILIGRVITERPDLFAAALIQVGCSDMLRFETTTNGVPNIPEFGSVKTRDGFGGLLEMSAYAHVQDGVKYPAVLLTHGINDPRVAPWNSAKMCARLQAASASGKPILLRIDYDAGHGIGSTRSQHENELADQFAFLLWQMGETK